MNLMRTDVFLRPKHPEFRNVKVQYPSCHSESSYILKVQDELIIHPYGFVGSEWLKRQSHSRESWGGLII